MVMTSNPNHYGRPTHKKITYINPYAEEKKIIITHACHLPGYAKEAKYDKHRLPSITLD